MRCVFEDKVVQRPAFLIFSPTLCTTSLVFSATLCAASLTFSPTLCATSLVFSATLCAVSLTFSPTLCATSLTFYGGVVNSFLHLVTRVRHDLAPVSMVGITRKALPRESSCGRATLTFNSPPHREWGGSNFISDQTIPDVNTLPVTMRMGGRKAFTHRTRMILAPNACTSIAASLPAGLATPPPIKSSSW